MIQTVFLPGDCRAVLKTLRAESVHCCVTSPPYWGLRNYGAARQIGLEETVEDYTAALVDVFTEVARVLRGDGTLWLNLGDTYTASGRGGDTGTSGLQGNTAWQDQSKRAGNRLGNKSSFRRDRQSFRSVAHKSAGVLLPKNLIGIPWRVAFALQAAGWILRSDIIWHKSNAMPESVTDRPTKAHEYLFLLTRSQRYFYDAEAIKEPVSGTAHPRGDGVSTRNKRDVWTVQTYPYDEAHFATFPPALIRPCILAGCPVGGTVLDPFGGSGTTGMVALETGRHGILIELNPHYLDMARRRCNVTPGLPLRHEMKGHLE